MVAAAASDSSPVATDPTTMNPSVAATTAAATRRKDSWSSTTSTRTVDTRPACPAGTGPATVPTARWGYGQPANLRRVAARSARPALRPPPSARPALREVAVARWFRWLYLGGRVLLVGYVLVFALPVAGATMRWAVAGLSGGVTRAHFWATLTSTAFICLPFIVAGVLWLAQVRRARR
jgi:hypothetical protein